MRCIIPDDRLPFAADQCLILNHKIDNSSPIFPEPNPDAVPRIHYLQITFSNHQIDIIYEAILKSRITALISPPPPR
jgi:hypothetical protein